MDTTKILENKDLALISHSTRKTGISTGKIAFKNEAVIKAFNTYAERFSLKITEKVKEIEDKLVIKYSAPTERALRSAIRVAKGKEETSIFRGALAKSFRFGKTKEEIKKEERATIKRIELAEITKVKEAKKAKEAKLASA